MRLLILSLVLALIPRVQAQAPCGVLRLEAPIATAGGGCQEIGVSEVGGGPEQQTESHVQNVIRLQDLPSGRNKPLSCHGQAS